MCAILYPLSLRPMFERELHRLLAAPRSVIRRNVKRLIDMGILVRREDKRLQMVVGLMLPKIPKVGTPVFMPSGVQAMAPGGKVQRPDPEDSAAGQAAPNFNPAPEPVHVGITPGPRRASARARMLSERLNVPESLAGVGEVSIGVLGKCVCGKATPIRYGLKTICPICVRKL